MVQTVGVPIGSLLAVSLQGNLAVVIVQDLEASDARKLEKGYEWYYVEMRTMNDTTIQNWVTNDIDRNYNYAQSYVQESQGQCGE